MKLDKGLYAIPEEGKTGGECAVVMEGQEKDDEEVAGMFDPVVKEDPGDQSPTYAVPSKRRSGERGREQEQGKKDEDEDEERSTSDDSGHGAESIEPGTDIVDNIVYSAL